MGNVWQVQAEIKKGKISNSLSQSVLHSVSTLSRLSPPASVVALLCSCPHSSALPVSPLYAQGSPSPGAVPPGKLLSRQVAGHILWFSILCSAVARCSSSCLEPRGVGNIRYIGFAVWLREKGKNRLDMVVMFNFKVFLSSGCKPRFHLIHRNKIKRHLVCSGLLYMDLARLYAPLPLPLVWFAFSACLPVLL